MHGRGSEGETMRTRRQLEIVWAFSILITSWLGLGVLTPPASGQGTIQTIAGGGPVNGTATAAYIPIPQGVALDASGNLYVSTFAEDQVYKVDTSGHLTVVAGNGLYAFSGDGGPATSAGLSFPEGIAVDKSGNVFIVDGNRIRRVDASTGIITTVAGNGTCGFSGDGGPATKAELCGAGVPVQVAVDASDNLYIADADNDRVRRVDGKTGVITTVAGNGQNAYCGQGGCGDGGPATSAPVDFPEGVALDSSDDVFIADTDNCRIRRVDASTGIITTVAGSVCGSSGDGEPATVAELLLPQAVALDGAGDIFIADTSNNVIREVNATTQIINRVAGNHSVGFMGDGGSAISAELNRPCGVAVSATGTIYIADQYNQRVRQVSSAGTITTVAGGGNGGDGGPATKALLAGERATVDSSDNIYLGDDLTARVRRVDNASQIIRTVAGTGINGFAGNFGGDGGAATTSELDFPGKPTLDSLDDLFIPDGGSNRIRRVDASTQVITTVAGGGSCGTSNGDGGPATSACLSNPTAVTLDAVGDVFIADFQSQRIRRVDAATQIITTVAGDGNAGYSGDGGPAVSAELSNPFDLAVDASGNLYIADSQNNRIRRVDAVTNVITTVAGNGTASYCGDGGLATKACLNNPGGLALDSEGNLYIADSANNRVRRVDAATQAITTIAGNGTAGFSGDGGPSTAAELDLPLAVSLDSKGNLFVSDGSNRVREFSIAGIANFTPASLSFANQNVGAASNVQTLSLSNTGSEALTIAGIVLGGTNGEDFGETNTCGSSVAAGASCTISVTFKPTGADSRSGTLTITDNSSGVAGSTQTVDLSGTGVAAEVTLGAITPAIAAENVGTASSASTVTLTNSGNASLTISALAISGPAAKDFAMQSSSTCSTKAAVAAGKSCTVSVIFTPLAPGSRSATLTITDNANDATKTTQALALSGTGKDFTLGVSAAATISPGQSAHYTLTVTSHDGFGGAVQVTCSEPSGLTESTCTPSQSSVTLNASSSAAMSVTVSTTAPSMIPLTRRTPPSGPRAPFEIPVLGMTAVLGALLWVRGRFNASLHEVGLVLLAASPGAAQQTLSPRFEGSRPSKRPWTGVVLVVAMLSVLLWASCGGGSSVGGQSNPGTAAGTFSLTVSATSGSIVQTATLSLKVQ